MKEIGEEYGRELPVLEIRSMIEMRVNPNINKKKEVRKVAELKGPMEI